MSGPAEKSYSGEGGARPRRVMPLSLAALEAASRLGDVDSQEPGIVSVLVFSRGARGFAVDVRNTEGVVECPRITPLPIAPDGIIGVAGVSGRITLVFDAAVDAVRPESKGRLILLKGDSQLGLVADQVQEVLALKVQELRQIPERRMSRRLLGAVAGGAESARLAKHYFKYKGKRVPVIDLELLASIG